MKLPLDKFVKSGYNEKREITLKMIINLFTHLIGAESHSKVIVQLRKGKIADVEEQRKHFKEKDLK